MLLVKTFMFVIFDVILGSSYIVFPDGVTEKFGRKFLGEDFDEIL